MQSSPVLSIGLPIALVIIMLGLGLSLKLENFARVLSRPKPILVGIACHSLVLPLLCLALVYVSDLPPAIAVGMMLLAASPGGSTASVFTHLARGDVALSLTMAGLTSLLAIITLPIVGNISLQLFFGQAETVYLEVTQVLQIFLLAIVPAIIGMLIHSRYPAFASRLERPVKILAAVFLIAVVLLALIGQWRLVVLWGPIIGVTVLIFNVGSLAVGYWMPRLLGIDRQQAIAIAMAIGIHNAALVITMALSEYMLDNSEMAIPPALYGLVAYVTCGIFVWLLNRMPRLAGLPVD